MCQEYYAHLHIRQEGNRYRVGASWHKHPAWQHPDDDLGLDHTYCEEYPTQDTINEWLQRVIGETQTRKEQNERMKR